MEAYIMVFQEEEEKWYFFNDDFDEEQFPYGYADYYIDVKEGLIIEDTYSPLNQGKVFAQVYDKELWGAKMSKYEVGQQLIIERHVAISVFTMNGVRYNEVIEYPKGEVIEVLEVLGDGDYKVEFWLDSDVLVNGEKVTYILDEDTIEDWLEEEEECLV